MQRTSGIVYLMQPEALIGTKRYKVGCSAKESLDRVEGYHKGSRCLLVFLSKNSFALEKKLKALYKKKYKLVAGTETFEGDATAMVKDFLELITIEINQVNKIVIDLTGDDEDTESSEEIEIVEDEGRLRLSQEEFLDDLKEEDNDLLREQYISAIEKDKLRLAKVLILSCKDEKILSEFLIIAIDFSNIEIISFLISNGIDINAQKGKALMEAIRKGNIEVVELLLLNGANIDAQKDQEMLLAAEFGTLNVLRYLILNGANAKHLRNELLLIATKYKQEHIIKYLTSGKE